MNDTFMKERPVLPLLLSMALPNVISMLVNSLYNIVAIMKEQGGGCILNTSSMVSICGQRRSARTP